MVMVVVKMKERKEENLKFKADGNRPMRENIYVLRVAQQPPSPPYNHIHDHTDDDDDGPSSSSTAMAETLLQRRYNRADVREVIDVDDWLLNPPAAVPQHLHRNGHLRRQPEPQPAEVIVIDSDGEDEVQITGHNHPDQRQRTPKLTHG